MKKRIQDRKVWLTIGISALLVGALPQTASMLLAQPTTGLSLAVQDSKDNGVGEIDKLLDDSFSGLALRRALLSYKITESKESRLEAVSAFETYIGEKCLAQAFKDEEHDPGKNSELCNQLIEKGLDLYRHLPTALCAKFGLESKTCRDAYATQQSADIPAENKSKIIEEIDAAAVKNDEKSLEKVGTLGSLRVRFDTEPNDNLKLEGLLLARELIGEFCKVRRIEYREVGLHGVQSKESSIGPLGLARATPTPGAPDEGIFTPLELSRWQLLSGECNKVLKEALQFEPNFPDAVCAKYGSFSPSCFDSVKKWRGVKLNVQRPGRRPVNPDSGMKRF